MLHVTVQILIVALVLNDIELAARTCQFFSRIWEVSADEVDKVRVGFQNGILLVDQIPIDILEWPATGNPHVGELAPDYAMAPFHDANGDAIYDPMEGDYSIALVESPDFIPFQFRFYVFNDNALHTRSQAAQLTMDFHVIDFVIDCTERVESEAAVFSRVKYINRSVEDWREFKLGIWEDSALGCPENDFLGCAPELNCSYVYYIMKRVLMLILVFLLQ